MTGRVHPLPRTAVSVDLDDLACYEAVYGGRPAPRPDDPVLARGLDRLLDLLADAGGTATFFCIGRIVEAALDRDGPAAAALRRAVAEGHEIAHHGYAHDYRIADAPADTFRRDLDRGIAALERLGVVPVGFRAPGYAATAAMLATLDEAGFAYDSSALPSPAYFVARRLVQVGLRAVGRPSASRPAIPVRDFLRLAPRRVGAGLWSLPISVSPRLRLPMVGTFLLAGPRPLRAHLARAFLGGGVVHLELHGLDAVDASDEGVPSWLARRAPELRVPVEVRLERLRRLLAQRPAPPSSLSQWVRALDAGRAGARAATGPTRAGGA